MAAVATLLALHQPLASKVEATVPSATGQPALVSIGGKPGAAGGGAKLGGGVDFQASSREIEKQIVDRILGEGYDKRIRPAGSGPYNASRSGE